MKTFWIALSFSLSTVCASAQTFETCYERIKGDANRPIVMSKTKEELKKVYDQRREIYMKHSTVRVECNGSPMENAEKIAAAVRK